MTTAIYLAHLNPVTNSHVEIIEELKKDNKVVVMPVRFLKQENEINSRSFPFNFEIRKKMLESVFGNSITVSLNYSFHAPFKKYFPPLISPKSWSLRKQILQGIVKNKMYEVAKGNESEWEKHMPVSIVQIINENWETVRKFASTEDMTIRIAGMKFPKDGYDSK